MKKLKFGLIGAGGIAQAYAQAFAASKSCNLVAVADVRHESAQALAEIVGGKSYGDYKMLAETETKLDAVIISTPPATHAEIACYFLDRKIPVLCEKPLCLSIAEAQKEVSGGGVLIDNGTHSVDIIRYFLGAIESVLAVDAGATQNLSVDENVKMFAKTRNGVTASVDLTWGINKDLPYFLSIYGTNGTLHVGWRESKYKLNSSPDWTIFGKGYDKVASFRGKIENFSSVLRGEEELLINPSDALASVQVIEAAYKSLNQNLWQKVVEKTEAAKV
jgi:predicted dehydrogenase